VEVTGDGGVVDVEGVLCFTRRRRRRRWRTEERNDGDIIQDSRWFVYI
jgi:hypothetical protein